MSRGPGGLGLPGIGLKPHPSSRAKGGHREVPASHARRNGPHGVGRQCLPWCHGPFQSDQQETRSRDPVSAPPGAERWPAQQGTKEHPCSHSNGCGCPKSRRRCCCRAHAKCFDRQSRRPSLLFRPPTPPRGRRFSASCRLLQRPIAGPSAVQASNIPHPHWPRSGVQQPARVQPSSTGRACGPSSSIEPRMGIVELC